MSQFIAASLCLAVGTIAGVASLRQAPASTAPAVVAQAPLPASRPAATGGATSRPNDPASRPAESQPGDGVKLTDAGESNGPAPAGASPDDIRVMRSQRAMLAAEARLKQLLKDGKIKGVDKVVSFEEIASWPYEDGLKGMPDSVKKLDKVRVMMTGFMLPIDEVENIKRFLLVQSLWSCCFGQPPDVNGLVRVEMQGGKKVQYQYDPIKVIGTFRVKANYDDDYCVDIYTLEADSVEVIN